MSQNIMTRIVGSERKRLTRDPDLFLFWSTPKYVKKKKKKKIGKALLLDQNIYTFYSHLIFFELFCCAFNFVTF